MFFLASFFLIGMKNFLFFFFYPRKSKDAHRKNFHIYISRKPKLRSVKNAILFVVALSYHSLLVLFPFTNVLKTCPEVISFPYKLKIKNKNKLKMSTEPYKNVHLLAQTNQLLGLYTIIRDKKTTRPDFIFYSDRIIRLLVEEGLNHMPVVPKTVATHTGEDFPGVAFQGKICGVSIVRAGESMEQGLRDCCRSVRIGKILIQRDEETALPKLFYEKLPEDIADRHVFLLDPMLATGGSAIMATDVLIKRGVKPERICFLNLICSKEGIDKYHEAFPNVKIITGVLDRGLNEQKYLVPGLGDFGDRYYCI